MSFTTKYPLQFTALDQAQQKAAFVDFLKQTSEFQNFNFAASGISSLLDVMSYQAYQQALMANFLFNENFLSTATKRQNVVARAQEMGYTPASLHASKAALTLTVTNVTGSPSSLVLPSNSIFTSSVNGVPYNFMTTVSYSSVALYDANGNVYYEFFVSVSEGLYSQNSVRLTNQTTALTIPNIDVDTTSIRVFVTLADNIEYEFYSPQNFLVTTSNEYVYFLAETLQGWKVAFGDGRFGYMPPANSVVRCSYVLGSGSVANGCAQFSFTGSIPGATSARYSTVTTIASAGGTDPESIKSIQTNAPNYFTTQNRAVTANDYKVLIKQSSNNIKDVLVWGGQDNVPPMFGKVIACVEPLYGDALTANEITNLQFTMGQLSVPNIGVVFVAPIYLNLIITSSVTYDSTQITLSTFDLHNTVSATIANFISNTVSVFNGQLYMSQLSNVITASDPSIISDNTSAQLSYKYTPTLYQSTTIVFSYNNALNNLNRGYVMKSSLFYMTGISSSVWIQDDCNGSLNILYSTPSGGIEYASYGVGKIDYLTGNVNVNGITITGVLGSTINFIAIPTSVDLASALRTILIVDAADIAVTTHSNN